MVWQFNFPTNLLMTNFLHFVINWYFSHMFKLKLDTMVYCTLEMQLNLFKVNAYSQVARIATLCMS
jgi:hypothetical protein